MPRTDYILAGALKLGDTIIDPHGSEQAITVIGRPRLVDNIWDFECRYPDDYEGSVYVARGQLVERLPAA